MIAPNPTPPETCRYGAPMGRYDAPINADALIRLRRVPINSGGYDAGGAYWGLGEPLWAYGDGERWAFCRAPDREAAKRIVESEYGAVSFWRN